MTGLHFVVRDYSVQKFDFAFIVVAVEQCLADLNTFALVLFSELFWHPSCTDFSEIKGGGGVRDTLKQKTLFSLVFYGDTA